MAAIAACAPAAAPPPTPADLARILAAEFDAPVLAVSVDQCRAGDLPGGPAGGDAIPVQVCNYCVVTARVAMAGNEFRGGGTRLWAYRSTGSAVLKQALSADHPGVSPPRGEPGVWVASSVTRASTAKRTMFPDPLASRTGYQPQTGWNAFGSMAMGQGDPPIPEAVKASFEADESLRQEAAALVEPCGTGVGAEGDMAEADPLQDPGAGAQRGPVTTVGNVTFAQPVSVASTVQLGTPEADRVLKGGGPSWWSRLLRRFRPAYDNKAWTGLTEVSLVSTCDEEGCTQHHAKSPTRGLAGGTSAPGARFDRFALVDAEGEINLLYDGRLLATVPGRYAAVHVTAPRDGVTALVFSSEDTPVVIAALDLRTRRLLTAFDAGKGPTSVKGMSRDGSRVFAARAGGNRVTLLDTRRRRALTLNAPELAERMTFRWRIVYPQGVYTGETGGDLFVDAIEETAPNTFNVRLADSADRFEEGDGPWWLGRVTLPGGTVFAAQMPLARTVELKLDKSGFSRSGVSTPEFDPQRAGPELATFAKAFGPPVIRACAGAETCWEVELTARSDETPSFVVASALEEQAAAAPAYVEDYATTTTDAMPADALATTAMPRDAASLEAQADAAAANAD